MNKYFDESDVNFFKTVVVTAAVVTLVTWLLT